MKYRVVRLDYWDYRFPLCEFDTREAAEKWIEDTERRECDPLVCYFIEGSQHVEASGERR